MELWASPEPTFARIDATTVRDQSAETGLDVRLDDAERIAALGVTASRVPVLWERVAPGDPHEHDFREPARRLEALRAAGIEPIVTLLHHGSGPQYTDLLDPAFPLWFAEYAEAAARAFPWVRRWTPINEPLTTARFATLYGVWFPNMRDDRAFGRAMVNQTLAQQAAMRRIRRVVPAAEFVLTEDLQRYAAGDAGVAEYAEFLRERVYLSAELVAGRVGEDHALATFLTERCGVDAFELAMMQRDAAVPDLVAFNHYPHSERFLFSLEKTPATFRRCTSPASRRRPPARSCEPPRSACDCRWHWARCTSTRPPANASVGWHRMPPTCSSCARTASTFARSARGRRSGWSIGIRCSVNARASSKTASTRLPDPTAFRNRRQSPARCANWRQPAASMTAACAAGGNVPIACSRLMS